MSLKRSLIWILTFVIVLGVAIQVTRLNTIITKKENTELMNSLNPEGESIDVDSLTNITRDKYLLIYDEGLNSKMTIENIAITLDYMKKDYDLLKVSEFNGIGEAYNNLVITVEEIESMPNVKEIFDFASNGGNVFWGYRLGLTEGFKNISLDLGIKEYYAMDEYDGIKLLENVMVKSKGFELVSEELLWNSSMDIMLEDDCKVYAASETDVPLLWSKNYGKGQMFYFNGTMLRLKINRGMISGIINIMDKDGIYPILNVKLNFIDDFPCPPPDAINETIFKDYRMDIARFYKEVWWPDVLKIGHVTNSIYTGYLIGTYNDKVFDLENNPVEISITDFEYYTKELFAAGGELGIHGYNHQPLSTNEYINKALGYNPWKDKETMIQSVKMVVDFARSRLKNYKITSYVAPSNIITEEGIDALRKGNEDLAIVSALYEVGNDILSADSYEQEISIDENGVINLPRLTSGYHYDKDTEWTIINGINAFGYFSHFIHPDDVLDENRVFGKGWQELYEEFSQLQSDTYKNYPWLEGMTVTEGANELIKYIKTDVYYEKTDEYINIYCDNFLGSMEFILRTEKGILKTEGCEATKVDDGIYLIKANKKESKIIFKG